MRLCVCVCVCVCVCACVCVCVCVCSARGNELVQGVDLDTYCVEIISGPVYLLVSKQKLFKIYCRMQGLLMLRDNVLQYFFSKCDVTAQ